MECRITGIYFIMSMKLWTILMINCPPSCNPINLSYRVYSHLDCLLRCTEFFLLVVVCVQCTFVSGTEHTFLSGSIIIVHRAHTYFLVLLQPLHRPSLFLASVQCVHLLLVLLQCTESTVISGIITVYRVHAYFIALFIRYYYSILFYAQSIQLVPALLLQSLLTVPLFGILVLGTQCTVIVY